MVTSNPKIQYCVWTDLSKQDVSTCKPFNWEDFILPFQVEMKGMHVHKLMMKNINYLDAL